MQNLLPHFRNTCHWIAAILLVLIPICVAADYGGMLAWTKYVAAIVVSVAVAFCVMGCDGSSLTGGRKHLLLAITLGWVAYAWCQTLSLPLPIVQSLSAGSADAYTQWLAPILPQSAEVEDFYVSVSPIDSQNSVAMASLVAVTIWIATIVFAWRRRVILLLSAISIAATGLACFGVFRILSSETFAFGFNDLASGSSYGTFVNRNNAALMLNLGLAASLGLLCWRLSALSGIEVDDTEFHITDLASLLGDRHSFLGLLGIATCLGALLICGSRGGFVAAIAGLVAAFGWGRPSRGIVGLPFLAGLIACCLAILIVPAQINTRTLTRFDFFGDGGGKTILNDGRLAHWPDGVAAGIAHLPMGSGLGTYGYAYLPFQNSRENPSAKPFSWAEHADNLWLELLVEQGVGGIFFALFIAILVVVSLRRLHDSPDPIDQGLRITGWFAFSAIVVSQCFDFGLIVPSNLVFAAILFGAIVTRSTTVPDQSDDEDTSLPQVASSGIKTKFDLLAERVLRVGHVLFGLTIGGIAIAFTTVCLTYYSAKTLGDAAKSELLTRRFASARLDVRANAAELQSWEQQIESQIERGQSAELFDTLATVNTMQARLTQTVERKPASPEQVAATYQSSDPETVRRFWYQKQSSADQSSLKRDRVSASDLGITTERALSYFGDANDAILKALAICPLGRLQRFRLVELDFANHQQGSKQTLEQLSALYDLQPAALAKLAQLAADSNWGEDASQLFRQALQLEPNRTKEVLQLAEDLGTIDLVTVLPDTPNAHAAAAAFALRSPRDYEELLAYLSRASLIESIESDSLDRRSRILETSADVMFAAGEKEEGIRKYYEAISVFPTRSTLRLKLIRHLFDLGNNAEAKAECRIGRRVDPNETRFETFIQKIAAEEIRQSKTSEFE